MEIDDDIDEPAEDGREPSEAPLEVLELAASCVRFVLSKLKIELDFTAETLPLVDHWLADAASAGDEAVRDLVIRSAGAYFGEVVRRTVPGARWHLEDDPSGWRIELEHVFLAFNPIGAAHEALRGAEAPGWNAHLETLPADRAALERAFERLGRVGEADYYRLSLRWELVEQAVTTLEAAAQARGEGARRFPPEVYAAALGERAPAADA